jgi:putative Holliday junction resolvase
LTHNPDNPPRSLLALDFGLRRIGIATGSRITDSASALATLESRDGEPDWDALDEFIREWNPDILLLGLPISTSGKATEMTAAVRDFADSLKSRYEIPVEFVDERYTSAEAEALLKEQRRLGIKTRRVQKSDIDSLAAQLIAESWMRENKSRS